MTSALVLLAALAGDPFRSPQASALALFGLGFGMVTQVLITAVQNSVERRDLGVATAHNRLLPRPRRRRRRRGSGRRVRGAGGRPVRVRGASEGGIDGVQSVFLVAAPIAALALAVVLLLRGGAPRGWAREGDGSTVHTRAPWRRKPVTDVWREMHE